MGAAKPRRGLGAAKGSGIKSMRELKMVGVLVLFAAAGGCSAEDPGSFQFDAGGRKDALPPVPDFEHACPQAAGAAPVIRAAPEQSSYRTVPLRGFAPGADTIVAQGPAGNFRPVAAGSDGSFCIEVELLPEVSNEISVVGIAEGCRSRPALLRISHHAASEPAPVDSLAHNVAIGAPTTASSAPDDGSSPSVLTDGKVSSFAEFSMFDPDIQMTADKFIWIKVDLKKAYSLSHVTLHWGPTAAEQKSYASCYALLLSEKAQPAAPDPASPDWVVVAERSDGDARSQKVAFSPTQARWAALLLYEDDAIRWNAMERFALAELEVHGQDPNAVPSVPEDRCY